MLLSYYVSHALRQFRQQKLLFAFHLAGLILALTTFFLIVFYVLDEYSYDTWIADANRIYRFETETTNAAGTVRLLRGSALRASRDLQRYFPEIEAATRLTNYRGVLSKQEMQHFETLWFADSTFFDVFDLPLVAGNQQSALDDKFSILLSESMAAKYFPDSEPVGATLALDNKRDYLVTGIFADIPQNSHFAFDFLLHYDELDDDYGFGYSENWLAFEGYTYIKLLESADAALIQARLPDFLDAYFPANLLPGVDELEERIRPRLQSLTGIHLSAGGINNIKPPGNGSLLLVLSGIAVLILTIACINFVSMTVSRSLERVREVAIRKVIGAHKGQLIALFLTETLLSASLATVAAFGLLEILLPSYNDFLGKDIHIDYLSASSLVLIGMSLTIIGLLSGYFPAQHLATQQPSMALRGQSDRPQSRVSYVRSGLIIFQFAISICLIISTTVVMMQQRFITALDLGFDPQNKLVLRNMNEDFSRSQRDVIRQEISSLPAVLGTAFSTATPADAVGAAFTRPVSIPGQPEASTPLYPKSVGPDFFDLYKIELVAGREFSDDYASERFFWNSEATAEFTPAAILNRAAVSALGFASAEHALNRTITMNGQALRIIGVAEDAHFLSLRSAMTPNLYIYSPDDHISLTVSYANAADVEQLIEDISALWNRIVPDFPVAIESIPENVGSLYRSEQLQLLLMMVFSSLAIVMTSIGLYALVAQMLQVRKKEISIRKIHGALARHILQSLSGRFLLPISIACIIAWPAAWYIAIEYLNGFEHRIQPSAMLFVFASLGAIAVIGSTIVGKTVAAARKNPVEALRAP